MQSIKSILVCGVLLAIFAAEAQAVMMNWSAVADAGNAADPLTGFGAVPYAYNIGTYDVTVNQYVEFLNIKDPTGANTLGLYDIRMNNTSYGGVSFSAGNANGNKYLVVAGRGNHPANASWYDSVRFANWVNNGQGNGDTETGAYTFGALIGLGVPLHVPLVRNAGAHVWMPTENEWYKAAYYDPGTSSYFQYPTSSNAIPIASSPTGLPNHANFYPGGPFRPTDVGAYTGTTSPYGAFDMAGNVWQWNEGFVSNSRQIGFGGSFLGGPEYSSSSFALASGQPNLAFVDIGIRLASAPGVPEPSTGMLAVIAAAMLWWWRKRFK